MNTFNIETAHSIKNNINQFLKNELFPRLELLFEEYNMYETVVRFDKLNINLTLDKLDNFEGVKHEIYNQLEDKFKQQIQPNLKDRKLELIDLEVDESGVQKFSFTKNFEETFLFFLENGYLPWFGKEENIVEFTQIKNWASSINSEVFLFNLKNILTRKETAIDRFILQFSNEVVFLFLEKVNPVITENKKELQKVLRVLKDNYRVSFLKFLIQVSLPYEQKNWIPVLKKLLSFILENGKKLNKIAGFPIVVEFKKVIQKVLPKTVAEGYIENLDYLGTSNKEGKQIEIIQEDKISEGKIISDTEAVMISETEPISILEIEPTTISKDTTSHSEKESPFFEKETNEIAVQNAGLILLHPFFKNFFIETGIANKQGILIKEKLDLAVQTLHFLSIGNENVFEGNLILEKFLCNIPLNWPVLKQSLLTDKIRAEASVMMKEVIKNWPALKNSSPDGLRQMFIQRDGKLIQKENNYKLVVERKAQDVLLEKLQWNISIVKLPWKNELLLVEW